MKIDRSELPVKQMPEKKTAAGVLDADNKPEGTPAKSARSEDAIQISREARDLQLRLEAAELEKQGLDVRAARLDAPEARAPQTDLNEVRAKLTKGFYETQEVTELVAERLLGNLGFSPDANEVVDKRGD